MDQSENKVNENEHKTNNKQRSRDARDQIAIDWRKSLTLTHVKSTNSNLNSSKIKMDAKTLDNLEAIDSFRETTELIQRRRDTVKPGIYRSTGGKWKKNHEPKTLHNERKVIEQRLQQIFKYRKQRDLRQRIGPQQKGGYQPQTQRAEQWTVDLFWDVDQPTPAQPTQYDQPAPSTSTIRQERSTPIPMVEGEVDSETDQDPSVLDVPATKWARYVEVKSTQCVKIVHAPKVIGEKVKTWDLEQAVRETEKNFLTDLQVPMTETTNDPTLSKTAVSRAPTA